MRTIIYNALMNSITLSSMVAGRIYETGSLGIGSNPANPDRPYLMIKESYVSAYESVRKVSPPPALRTYQIFVYAERGDFDSIEIILSAVRQTILGVQDSRDVVTGTVCLDVRWLADSGDAVDSQHDTNVKYAIFQIASNN